MLTLGCTLVAGRGAAQGVYPPPTSPDCCKGYYEKVVTCYRQECCDVPCPVVVQKTYYRDVCEPVKTVVMVPQEYCVKQPKTITVQVPCEQIKHVTRYRQVPVKKIDPCTGCCIVTCKTECYTEAIKYVVMQPKCETIWVDVKMCRQVPVEKIEYRTRKVPEVRCETVMTTRRECKMVPYQKTIRVPCPPPHSGAYSVEVPFHGPAAVPPPAGIHTPPPPYGSPMPPAQPYPMSRPF
jgi:hypothetical protein